MLSDATAKFKDPLMLSEASANFMRNSGSDSRNSKMRLNHSGTSFGDKVLPKERAFSLMASFKNSEMDEGMT
jgi:hypothetical protein